MKLSIGPRRPLPRTRIRLKTAATLALAAAVPCAAQIKGPKPREAGTKSALAQIFKDISATAGISMPGVLTEAVAWGDYDDDGDPDLYFANQGQNRLFRNDGAGVFTDVTLESEVGDTRHGKAAAFGDLDNDGDLDLYVVNAFGQADVLYRNELKPVGVATFTDVTAGSGITDTRSQGGVALADVNRDGRLDVYIAARGQDILYKNAGAMQFLPLDLNLAVSPDREGAGAVATDFNGDGWIDIFASSRTGEPALLLVNSGGTLTDQALASGVSAAGDGGGVIAIDYNRDQRLDLYWGRFPSTPGREKPNRLFRNDPGNVFVEVGGATLTQDLLGWAMGANTGDYDNDGWIDFFLANGSSPTSSPSVLFRNNGNGTFSSAALEIEGGAAGDCRGVAFADFDRDGDLDLCVTGGAGTPTRLWRNDQLQGYNWIKVKLTGRVSNRAGIGAQVRVFAGAAILVQEISGGAGLGSQNEQVLHFGVGPASIIDFVQVRWPNGRTQLLSNVAINKTLDIIEPTPTPDLNGDGIVAVDDLLMLLGSWGDCLNCAADLDADGFVSVTDLISLLGSFTPTNFGEISPFPAPVNGWTPLSLSADARVIYVSSSDGDDAFSGLTPLDPVRTLSRGVSLLRDGVPDWLLLKRGDTWTNENFGTWTRSGRSGTEPIVVGSYGTATARPFIMSGSERALVSWDGADFVALVGLHFEPSPGNPAGTNGIAWRGRTNGVLLEDLYVAGYKKNLQVQNDAGVGPIQNVIIRRCVIVDSHDPNSQGIYAWDARITVEECVFDRNGYLPATEIHNHGLYLDGNAPFAEYAVRRTIVTRSGSQGFKVQPKGGTHEIIDNLAVANPIHMGLGGIHSSQSGVGMNIVVRDNVLLEPTDIEGQPRGWGIVLNNLASGTVEGNILAHRSPLLSPGVAILAGDPMFGSDGAGINNLTVRDNIVHNWRGTVEIRTGDLSQYSNILIQNNTIQDTLSPNTPRLIDVFELPLQITQVAGNSYYSMRSQPFTAGGQDMDYPQWLSATQELSSTFGPQPFADPSRSIGSYMQSIGAGSTIDDFVAAIRLQSKGTGMGLVDGVMTTLPAAAGSWRPEFDAATVNQYIRAGFQ